MKIVVMHAGYGCDTGCCGHVIEVDGEMRGEFSFSHPDSNKEEDLRQYAEELVTEEMGAEHVTDLDWENCRVVDD